jgi:hypothetical protein
LNHYYYLIVVSSHYKFYDRKSHDFGIKNREFICRSKVVRMAHPAKLKELALLTIPALKDLCDKKGLKVGGNKPELVQRLMEANTKLEDLYVDMLRIICEGRGRAISGSKEELIQNLRIKSTVRKVGQTDKKDVKKTKPVKKKVKLEQPTVLETPKTPKTPKITNLKELEDIFKAKTNFLNENQRKAEKTAEEVLVTGKKMTAKGFQI